MYNKNINGVLLLSQDFETKEEALKAMNNKFFKYNANDFNEYLKTLPNKESNDYFLGVYGRYSKFFFHDEPVLAYDIKAKEETEITPEIIKKLELIGNVTKINDFYLIEKDNDKGLKLINNNENGFFEKIQNLKNNLKFDNAIDEYFKVYNEIQENDLLFYTIERYSDHKENSFLSLPTSLLSQNYILVSKAFLYDCNYGFVDDDNALHFSTPDKCIVFRYFVEVDFYEIYEHFDYNTDCIYRYIYGLEEEQQQLNHISLGDDVDDFVSHDEFRYVSNMLGHLLLDWGGDCLFMPDIKKLERLLTDEVERMKDELELFITNKKDLLIDSLPSLLMLKTVMQKSYYRFDGLTLYEFALNLYKELLEGKRKYYILHYGAEAGENIFPLEFWFNDEVFK